MLIKVLIGSCCQKLSVLYGCNRSGKKITLDYRIDVSSCSSQRNQFNQKMNDRLLLLSLTKITHYFKKWTTGSGVSKKIYSPYKNVMLQIDAFKSSCSQKQQYPKRILRLKVLRKSSSLKKVAIQKVTLASAIVSNCSSEIFTMLYYCSAITVVKLSS